MLLDVITRVAAEAGISLQDDRILLLSLYNQSTRILHHQLEANKMFREITLIVPANMVISLPPAIGEVKGIRVHSTEMLVPLQQINTPRYTNSTLLYKIKNWRDLGNSPVQCNLTTIGQLVINVANVEASPVTLKIRGQTPQANNIEEEVLVNSTTVGTTNQFGPSIYSIACFDQRTNDIVISDQNGNILATLFNQYQKTRYKIIDVSQIFWPYNDTAEGNSFIDVCYKLPFIPGFNDTDEFSGGDDYDDAIYHMMMHLHWSPQGGKENQAKQELMESIACLKSVKDGEETGMVKKMNFGRNKFYSLFTRGRHRLSGNDYGMYYADLVDW